MATPSATSTRSFVTAVTSFAANTFSDYVRTAHPESVLPEDVPLPESRAETVTSSTASTAVQDDGDTATQVTMDDSVAPDDSISLLAERLSQLPVPKGELVSPPKYGTLDQCAEGKETRKQMLERRRKDCAAEEVDVALAPVLRIPVPYVFYPEQYKRFREMFPRITPDPGLSYTHHDHPVSHTATMVGIRKMQNSLEPGDLVLDIHGNPTSNEAFNSFQARRRAKRPNLPTPPVIETMVEMMHHSDAVRKVLKWGPSHSGETPRYFQGSIDDIPARVYNVFFMVHTLYYYSMYQVNKLLAANPGAKVVALVNFSPEQTGTLYGELKFGKNDGLTRQVSPNGESYTHPDIDRWFQTQSFRGATQELKTGISWTSTCIGGPLYLITIASCPWDLARRHSYEPPAAPTLVVGHGSLYFGWVRIGDTNVQLRISNHGLASELRHWMTMRDRNNPEVFSDLCVKARRLTSTDFVVGSRQFYVADGDLSDHIIYAFLVDAPGELELLEGVKLLRGSLLKPHSEALKLQGKDNVHGWFHSTWFYQTIVARPAPDFALGGRASANTKAAFEKPVPRSAGLLPTKRT